MDVVFGDWLWFLIRAPGPALGGMEVQAAAGLYVWTTAVWDAVVQVRHQVSQEPGVSSTVICKDRV